MSSAVKPRRVTPSTVNRPVTVHILNSKPISREDTERFLTEFIDEEEVRSQNNLLETTIINTDVSASISQLKRIQRNLRGLPPLETALSSTPAPTSSESTNNADSINPKKHKRFDDEEEEPENLKTSDTIEESTVQEDDSTIGSSSEKKLSKEERKKAKKEKKEKKEKKSKK